MNQTPQLKMKHTSKEQKQLIEEIGLVNEERLGLSPLASRIYALLAISSDEGITFDEIREIIQTTKSSTSVNINVLTQLNYAEYHTKPGDRKRYFRMARNYQQQALERYHQSLENDTALVEKINTYNKVHNPEKFKNEKSLGVIMKNYFKEQQKLIKATIQKIESFRAKG